MGRFRLIFPLALLLLCAAALFLPVGHWGGAGVAEVGAVPPGHQEIAWISPATSGDSWERLVAALELLQKESAVSPPGGNPTLWGKSFHVNVGRAFLPLTADVPEIALYFDDA